MSFVDPRAGEINFKIAYYGPGLAGKATTLRYIHDKIQPVQKTKLFSVPDMVMFFSLLTRTLPLIGGLRPRIHLYTASGESTHEAERNYVAKGADAIVFVADSQAARSGDNLESFADLERQLASHGRSLQELPLVMQYNKRDLPQALPVPELDALLSRYMRPRFETVATVGTGLFETLRTVTEAIVGPLRGEVEDLRSGQ